MSRCAVVNISDNTVVNVIVAEVTDLAPDGTFLVELQDGVGVNMGYVWDGGQFIDPNPPVEEDTPIE